MATVIDALVVTLGMNAKGFKQGAAEVDSSLTHTREESAKTAREMEVRGKQAAMFFSKVRNEALALLAVFTAGMGIKSFVSSTIQSTASLSRLSENLNMSAQDLAEWQLAAKNAGGSVEGITEQLKESADQVAKFKRGMAAETLPAFFQFGGKTEDLKDGNTYLEARARIVAGIYKTDRARAALAANMMGLDAQQFNLYKDGPEGIARRRREQSGPAAEQAAAAQRAEQLRQKYDTAMNKLSSVGVNVLTALMPAFEFAVDKLIEFGNWIIQNRAVINETVKSWVKGAEQFFGGLSKFGDKINEFMDTPVGRVVKKALDIGVEATVPKAAREAERAANPGAMRYDDPKLNDYAAKVERDNGLPAGLLNAIKNKGERSNSDQVSPAGAKGVMQFMPGTWGQYGKGDITNPYDSIDAAGRYFVDLMKRYNGSVDAAITEYNGGIKQARAVQAGGSPSATETINYLARVKEGLNGNAALGAVNLAQAAQPSAQSGNNATTSTTTNTSETHISGPITVVTAATDGAGIARELGGIGKNQTLVQQGNTGLF
ncbi:lytic transglycosylase domain-containing protein [Achromobacter marplatensis]|uniref:Lytic transglycosylase domain-containing protein n=1 Tax=Achromobacter marplatensis TaxID=470868 RepID=A0AA42WCM7_9BURK|nr:lytic transglycosylase domain-containing protein [Achromobacter marplatensis]MDH2051159.1 lytic transglycosylase domain-containing protein [Achromobacter marplatensis]